MIETMLVFPLILLIGFGIVHGGLVYQAQANLEYAALMAARVGATNSMDVETMKGVVAKRMSATSGLDPSSAASSDIELAKVDVVILNPTREMFDVCGRRPSFNTSDCVNPASCEIPYYGLQYFSRTDPGSDCAGVSIQDANILRVKVTYEYDSKVPLLNRIWFVGESRDEQSDGGITLSAVATVRMQSPARLTFANVDYLHLGP